jgi:hypothetical protein
VAKISLSLASKLVARVSRFVPQTGNYGLVIWASKSPRQFLGLCLKTKQAMFVGCASKPMGGCDGVGQALRSSSWLRMEASQGRVSQFTSKLAEARRRLVHVAPSRRPREDQVEDGWIDAMGCVGPY